MKSTTFTAMQQRAVVSDAPRILCGAGPGSGKTTVLVERLIRLIEKDGRRPDGIVAITFTQAAARNLEERLGIGGEQGVDRPVSVRLGYCGTLHGYALRMLKLYGEPIGYGGRVAIIDEASADSILESKARSLGCKLKLADLHLLKAAWPYGVKRTNTRFSVEDLVIWGYYDELREAGLVDFDSLLLEFLRLLECGHVPQFDHLFVDEVQDSGALDWRIYDRIPAANKFFVGDPDQAIYGFRGGRSDLMLAYGAQKGTNIILLEENFRCPEVICRAADRLIEGNDARLPKKNIPIEARGLGTCRQFGEAQNEGDEISQITSFLDMSIKQGTAPGEIAVLARSNAIAAGIRAGLKAAGIPVKEPEKRNTPPDWARARSLIELLAQPSNNTLAFFYLIERELAFSNVPENVARIRAHQLRNDAALTGIPLNDSALFLPKKATVADIAQILEKERITRESRMLIAEKLRELPPDAGLLELALELVYVGDHFTEQAEGVTVTTFHNSKGREWDLVICAGLEDEVIPGKRAGTELEEERRILFVGMTRAKRSLFFTHSSSRKANWGNNPIISHTPSRFLKEVFPS